MHTPRKIQSTYLHRTKPRDNTVQKLLSGVVAVGLAGAACFSGGVSAENVWAALPGSGCDIKGNISLNTGERIYHVPGQKYYRETNIWMRHGERWFCSEQQAREAGWRKSRR